MPSAGFSTRRYANAYALFNEPERRRGHKVRRERSQPWRFSDRSF
ncbi:hypothetical protein [Nostoc sp.]